jgi:hypothetical protein
MAFASPNGITGVIPGQTETHERERRADLGGQAE